MAVSISATAFVTSGSLSVPAHNTGDLILYLDRSSTSTPPTLISGFESVSTSTNSTSNVSMRLQYQIANGSLTSISTTAGGRVWIAPGAIRARGINRTSSGANTTSHTTSSLTSCGTTGSSMLIAGIRALSDTIVSGVSAGWTTNGKDYVTLSGNTNSTSPTCTITSSLSVADCNFIAELVGATTFVTDAGSFTFTGAAASLEYGCRLASDAGSYALTGANAGLVATRRITAETASFTLTGAAVTLVYGHPLSAGSASFILTGGDVSFIYSGDVIVTDWTVSGINPPITRWVDYEKPRPVDGWELTNIARPVTGWVSFIAAN